MSVVTPDTEQKEEIISVHLQQLNGEPLPESIQVIDHDMRILTEEIYAARQSFETYLALIPSLRKSLENRNGSLSTVEKLMLYDKDICDKKDYGLLQLRRERVRAVVEANLNRIQGHLASENASPIEIIIEPQILENGLNLRNTRHLYELRRHCGNTLRFKMDLNQLQKKRYIAMLRQVRDLRDLEDADRMTWRPLDVEPENEEIANEQEVEKLPKRKGILDYVAHVWKWFQK